MLPQGGGWKSACLLALVGRKVFWQQVEGRSVRVEKGVSIQSEDLEVDVALICQEVI